MQEHEVTSEHLWRLYEKGNDQHSKTRLEDLVNQAYRFYEGDQWHGLESGGPGRPGCQVRERRDTEALVCAPLFGGLAPAGNDVSRVMRIKRLCAAQLRQAEPLRLNP